MKPCLWTIWCLVFFLLAIGLVPGVAEPLRIGSIRAEEPAGEIKKFTPFARYLAKQLQADGIDEGKVVVAQSVLAMATLMREGKVDLFIDSFFPSLAVSQLSGSKIFLRRWKKGLAEYDSIIYTHKDSRVYSLEDLQGKIVAFEDPHSTSGYFFPKVVLQQQGLIVVPKDGITAPVGRDEIGYVFSYDDENSMVWVLNRRVAASATDPQSFEREVRGSGDRLRILYRIASLPRQLVSYRADLSPKLVANIRRCLLELEQSEEGKKALQGFERTTRFDDLPAATVELIRQTQPFVTTEIGQ